MRVNILLTECLSNRHMKTHYFLAQNSGHFKDLAKIGVL